MAARVLYENSRTLRYRLLEAFFWGLAAMFTALAWSTRVADPLNNHAAFLVLAGVCVFSGAAFGLFLLRSVTRITRDGATLTVETLAPFSRRRLTLPAGEARFGNAAITGRGGANHVLLHVAGRRWPFVIDTTKDRLLRG